MTSLIGKVLQNQFRVDAFIAAGGMGAVYRVWDQKRNVPLAMKVLHADLQEDPSILKRFQREARALQELAHPNIVPFYGLYQTAGFAFLLEHYIDGPTLKELLRQRAGEPLPSAEALAILKALCAALGYAHAHGVVHCDIKPGNVMVDQGGNVYLTDFGIARHAESTTTTLGQAGSPAYMTPEQIRGEPVTPATDVYALGVLLFEMLTGQRPFSGAEEDSESGGASRAERTKFAHLLLSPPDPQDINPELPGALVQVLLTALAKDPHERYENAPAVYEAVWESLNISPAEIVDRVNSPELLSPESLLNQTVEDSLAAASTKYWSERTRRLWPFVGFLGLVIMAIWILAVSNLLVRGGESNFLILGTRPTEPTIEVVGDYITANPLDTLEADSPQEVSSTANLMQQPTRFPTQLVVRATSTPRPIPRTPTPRNPQFTASEDMFCRDGPGPGFEAHTTIMKGQTLPVLAKWFENHWLLIGINNPSTRTKCCWVGGDGHLNVNITSLRQIDFRPDRMTCPL
jgi:serine/threonine protein kinase